MIEVRQSLARAGAFLTSAVTTLALLLCLTFVITHLLPADPVAAVVGETADPEVYARARAEMGLDRPLHEQFGRYLGSLIQGSLGDSSLTGAKVEDDLARVFPATVELATAALLMSVLLGLPMGIVAAINRGRLIDQLVRAFGLLGLSTPPFWLALMGLSFLYGRWGLLWGPGQVDPALLSAVPVRTHFLLLDALLAGDGEVFGSALGHLILPVGVLTVLGAAFLSRLVRTYLLEQLGQEYVLAARAKGVRGWGLIWRHPLRNSWIQIVTVIALGYAGLLEGSVLIELVFSWPGLGGYMATAVMGGDVNAVSGGVLLIGIVFIALNLAADLASTWLDPRIGRR